MISLAVPTVVTLLLVKVALVTLAVELPALLLVTVNAVP
jgi:hypothetical protein